MDPQDVITLGSVIAGWHSSAMIITRDSQAEQIFAERRTEST